MGYDIHESHTSASGYVAPKLARPLKTGAEVSNISTKVCVSKPIGNSCWRVHCTVRHILLPYYEMLDKPVTSKIKGVHTGCF